MKNPQINQFLDKIRAAILSKTLVKLVLSNQRDRASDLKSVTVTIVEIKKGTRLNFVYRYKTRDVTKNFDLEEAMALAVKLLEDDFLNADLFAGGETTRLLITGHGKAKLRTSRSETAPVASFSHDHRKERLVATQGNTWLRGLGILNSAFEVRHDMNDKYLQINRYIELIEPFIRELGLPGEIHITDMGSGKGYLTFALYDYLTGKTGQPVTMTGIESRKELVEQSNRLAREAGFTGLTFTCGTIRETKLSTCNILVALHACDTATDDAIYKGITSGASLIVCAPCCHKQVRKDLKVPDPLKGLLKHGILEERQAEIITDGIRAMMLEAHGYKTKVFEFISTEHTPKNVMIVGRKTRATAAGKAKSLAQIRKVKEVFGVGEHWLEGLFRDA